MQTAYYFVLLLILRLLLFDFEPALFDLGGIGLVEANCSLSDPIVSTGDSIFKSSVLFKISCCLDGTSFFFFFLGARG
jgi:hypothetical protein